MSHRGICPWCGQVIWMGQPCRIVHNNLWHTTCKSPYEKDRFARQWYGYVMPGTEEIYLEFEDV